MRRSLFACVALLAGCGAQVESDPESCALEATEHEKSWFVGELDTDEDNPVFVAKVSIVEVESNAPTPPQFVDAEAELQIRFDITAQLLIVRTVSYEPTVIAGFPIDYHRSEDCSHRFNPSPFLDVEPPPGTQPWYLRPWFQIDWGINLVESGHRFDAAAAAGHFEAVSYVPVRLQAPELELDSGHLAVTVGTRIEWQDIDAETQGCVYDFPDLPPGGDCPDVLLKLRYEFRPAGAPP